MADLTKCRGCGKPLFDTDDQRNRAVSIEYGTLEGDAEDPQWSDAEPAKGRKRAQGQEVWGRMHERCFLLIIGDRRGVELAARHAG